jgi:heterodisulfide reductase subunit B
MKYALFLGCTVPARARNYELSVRTISKKLGIEIVDIGEFSCCGFPIKGLDQELTLLMAARNLCLAEEQGIENIAVVCSACASVLAETVEELNHDKELKEKVNNKLKDIGHTYKGTAKVKHFARILYEDVGLDKIKSTFKTELKDFKFAPHYGCHYLKPTKIYDKFDDPENPQSLKKLIELTGATSVDYENLMQCCGGAILAMEEKIALGIAKEKLDHIKTTGADAIVLVCPFCNVMYDSNQMSVEQAFNTEYGIPVLYLPQILGLAMGIDRKELGLQMHVIKTKELLEKLTGETAS